MRTVDDFLRWEQASRDTIDVKRCYIDLAGDLVAGVLLSQLIYWFLPNRHGSKLRVEREGRLWLAKQRTDWWEECRISPKQFDRAIQVLADKGLVEHRRFRFGGSPIIHVWLNWPAVAEGVNSILTFGEIASVPSGQLELDERDRTITETTSETTSETTDNDDRPAELGEFEQNLGVMLTPLVADAIIEYVGKCPEDWVSKAIGVAAGRDARNWAFVKKVLDNWLAAGQMTLEAPGRKTPRSAAKVDHIEDADKYVKGKYGHMVNRGEDVYLDLETIVGLPTRTFTSFDPWTEMTIEFTGVTLFDLLTVGQFCSQVGGRLFVDYDHHGSAKTMFLFIPQEIWYLAAPVFLHMEQQVG